MSEMGTCVSRTPPGTSSGELKSLGAVARLMAERTTQSWTTVPHFFVLREIDAGPLVQTLEKARASADKKDAIRVTHTDLLVALIARVLLPKHPRINSSWAGTGIRPNKDVKIALAIAVNDGVVTGVIQNADRLELRQIAGSTPGDSPSAPKPATAGLQEVELVMRCPHSSAGEKCYELV